MAPITPYISDGVTWHQANCALSDGVVWSGADILINPASVSGPTEMIFHMTSNLTQKLYFTQSQANGVLIDWGDGSQPETYSELSAVTEHTYATAGDYIVTMGVTPGVTWSPGATIQSLNSNNETVTTVYGLLGNYSITTGKTSDFSGTEQRPSSFPTLTAFSFGIGATLTEPKALAGASSLREIVLPLGLTSVPDYAFSGCRNLKSIICPETITSVGNHAFSFCDYYDFVLLASKLITIGNYAFSHCSGEAGYLELKASSVGVGAFEYCSGLQRVWLRNTISYLNVTETISTQTQEVTEYKGPFFNCDDGLILYAECYEADKPTGWMAHFNAQSGVDKVFLVIWHQTTAPFVSLRMVWNAHGRELSFIDDNDLEIGYEYDPVDSRLITY